MCQQCQALNRKWSYLGGPKIEIKKPVENKRYPRSSSESEIKYFSHGKNTKPGQFDDE